MHFEKYVKTNPKSKATKSISVGNFGCEPIASIVRESGELLRPFTYSTIILNLKRGSL